MTEASYGIKDSQCAQYDICVHCGRELYEGDKKFQWDTERLNVCEECFLELCQEMGAVRLADAMGLEHTGAVA